MNKSKRIFVISDFKDDRPSSIRIERRHWPKGFIRLGHDVQRFSYKNIMRLLSPFKFLKRTVGKNKMQKALTEQIKYYHPDIIFISAIDGLDADTIDNIRKIMPNAKLVGRDCDWFPEQNKKLIENAKKMDILIASNAGEWLEIFKKTGIPICAFIPCPCDPDIQHPYEVNDSLKIDIIFTGKDIHSKYRDKSDFDRQIILKKLSMMSNAKIYGKLGKTKIEGIDVFKSISGAKVALSINAVNNIRMCHSDRLINCLSCGTFTLAKRVPDTNLLFKDSIHLRYFDTADEFFELADWYLKHDKEREKIAQAGMEHAHKEFNCTRIAKLLIDLIEKGSYDTPWKVIL